MNTLGRRAAPELLLWPSRATRRVDQAAMVQQRRFTVSMILTPPLVFTGLLVSLWTYKCLVMVIFQNKIIYMPSVPPFSRSERIEDYTKQCGGITWKEERIKASDGVDIALAVASVDGIKEEVRKEASHIAIVYCQGSVTHRWYIKWSHLNAVIETVVLCLLAYPPFPWCSKLFIARQAPRQDTLL